MPGIVKKISFAPRKRFQLFTKFNNFKNIF